MLSNPSVIPPTHFYSSLCCVHTAGFPFIFDKTPTWPRRLSLQTSLVPWSPQYVSCCVIWHQGIANLATWMGPVMLIMQLHNPAGFRHSVRFWVNSALVWPLDSLQPSSVFVLSIALPATSSYLLFIQPSVSSTSCFLTPILNLHIFMFCCFFFYTFCCLFSSDLSPVFILSSVWHAMGMLKRSQCMFLTSPLSVSSKSNCLFFCSLLCLPPHFLYVYVFTRIFQCLRTAHVFTGLVMHLSVHSSPCFCICMYVCQYLQLCVWKCARVSVHVRVVLSVPADGSSLSSIVPVKWRALRRVKAGKKEKDRQKGREWGGA